MVRRGSGWLAPGLLGALAVVCATGCPPEVGSGQYTCDPNSPAACPPDWYCIPHLDHHECHPDRGQGVCGDGKVQPGEQCDGTDFGGLPCARFFPDRVGLPEDATPVCLTGCRVHCAWCGNEVVDRFPELDLWEECDDGPALPTASCTAQCKVPRCGDGILQEAEACDDGNTTAGDGCSATCEVEVCGNGVLDPQEQCDDGNFRSHDGCDSVCRSELPVWSRWRHPLDRGRTGHAMAYDRARDRVVLFGGWDGERFRGDTWEYDGTEWLPMQATSAPPPRSEHAMAYDAASGRVVLFGGWDGQTMFGDTWTWDGTTWEAAGFTSPPAARANHALVYDADAASLVLFGGLRVSEGSIYQFNDTWSFQDGEWSPLPVTSPPSARFSHAMAWDSLRGRVVLFGGQNQAMVFLRDTWELTGTTWSQVVTASAPAHRADAVLVEGLVPGVLLLHGGTAWAQHFGDLWAYDGSSWTEVVTGSPPAVRSNHAVAYDAHRGQVLVHGGRDGQGVRGDLWALSGTTWTPRVQATEPPARQYGALVYEPPRGASVLFGGMDATALPLGDTWEHDGEVWRRVTPASAPEPRYGHAMAYDRARDRVVLFGGVGGSASVSSYLGDTWEYDGAEWTAIVTAHAPSPRAFGTLFYDPVEERMVLYGGLLIEENTTEFNKLGDTWIYDGLDWESRTRLVAPGRRSHTVAAHLPGREVAVLFGGYGVVPFGDAWWFRGTTWTEIGESDWLGGGLASGPPARFGHVLVADPLRARLLLFGGYGDQGYAGDTWELGWVPDPQADPVTEPHRGWWQWQDVMPSVAPEPQIGAAAVYDVRRRQVLLFGGRWDQETWIFRWQSQLDDERCDNGLDDDGDTLIDCDDPDCQGAPGC